MINLRKRILFTFTCVLFFSFTLVGLIFNVVLRVFNIEDDFAIREVGIYVQSPDLVSRAGLILLVLIGITFAVAVVATYVLANSITKPIEMLEKFALDIGRGKFDPNNFEFQDIELDNLNAALNKSVTQLGAYDNEQKIFFQNVSHELRTPLMSIKCYAEGVVYGIMEPKQAGETILEETDKLAELVTDLLYIAKIDNITTVYKSEIVDIGEIVRQCIARQEAIAAKKGIEFELGGVGTQGKPSFDGQGVAIGAEGKLNYRCVPELISRAVDNLISNAVRYAQGKIMLDCHVRNGYVQIIVADDGNGIEPETLPHVFERFYKGKGGNTGIGLSIVKSIAAQHRGHVHAKNDGGAVFTLSLPV